MLHGAPPSAPPPNGQGGTPPYNPRTGVFLIALSRGYGGVDYVCFGVSSEWKQSC